MNPPDYEHIAVLVTRTQDGDSNAFAEIYSLTYNKVYNYACHYLKDTHLAQDAVQEVFISALKNISSVKNPLSFIAWLNQVSFHVCFDLAKKRNESYGLVDDLVIEQLINDQIYEGPETQIMHEDFSLRIERAIYSLPTLEKEVVILKYYNNMKLEYIAKTTGVSKSTVKRHLCNAKQLLNKMLKDEEDA